MEARPKGNQLSGCFSEELASPGQAAQVREQVAILEDAISHVTAHDPFTVLAIL